MKYETAASKARLPDRVNTSWLETAWYIVGGLAAVGLIISALAAFSDYDHTGAGWLFLLAAPFVALGPVTVGMALRRSARIERLLEKVGAGTGL